MPKQQRPAIGQWVLIGHSFTTPSDWWPAPVEWANADQFLVTDYRHGNSYPTLYGWEVVMAYGERELVRAIQDAALSAYHAQLPALRDANVAQAAAKDALRIAVQDAVEDARGQAAVAATFARAAGDPA